MNPKRLYTRILGGAVSNVRFADLRRLVEALGYELRRVRGDHHVFKHPAIEKKLNLQPDQMAMPRPIRWNKLCGRSRDTI